MLCIYFTTACYTPMPTPHLCLSTLYNHVSLFVCMYACYRGKRTATISLTDDVTDMCVISLKKSKVTHALLVGLASGDVRLYQGSTMLHSFSVEKPVIALRFGFYGQEVSGLGVGDYRCV